MIGVDDFFVGIGDINGSFLPPTTPSPIASSSLSPAPTSPSSSASSPPPATPPETGLIAQAKLLDHVSEERPLAKMQEELEKAEDADAVGEDVSTNEAESLEKSEEGKKSTTPPGSSVRPRKPLLKAFDEELDRVAKVSAGSG